MVTEWDFVSNNGCLYAKHTDTQTHTQFPGLSKDNKHMRID